MHVVVANQRLEVEEAHRLRKAQATKAEQQAAALTNPMIHFAVNEQSEKFAPHGSETTSLRQLDETSLKGMEGDSIHDFATLPAFTKSQSVYDAMIKMFLDARSQSDQNIEFAHTMHLQTEEAL